MLSAGFFIIRLFSVAFLKICLSVKAIIPAAFGDP